MTQVGSFSAPNFVLANASLACPRSGQRPAATQDCGLRRFPSANNDLFPKAHKTALQCPRIRQMNSAFSLIFSEKTEQFQAFVFSQHVNCSFISLISLGK